MNGIGRWSPAVRSGQRSNAGAHRRGLPRPLEVGVERAVEVEAALDGREHLHVPGQVGDGEGGGGDHRHEPAAARALPAREHHEARHREAVEDGQQHGRGLDVAADQRQPEERADREDRDHRQHGRQRQDRLAAGVQPGEHEADRHADHQRLAQRVAEVLERPERHLLGAAAAAVGHGQLRSCRAASAGGRRSPASRSAPRSAGAAATSGGGRRRGAAGEMRPATGRASRSRPAPRPRGAAGRPA